MIDEIVAEEFASPDLELHWLDEDEGDPETVLEGRLKVGALTLNEMRDALGLDPFDNRRRPPDGAHRGGLCADRGQCGWAGGERAKRASENAFRNEIRQMKPPLPRTLSAVPHTLHVRLEIAKAIRTLAGPDEDELLRQRRVEIAAIRRDLEVLSRDLHKAFKAAATLAKAELGAALEKYSADQPRVPAGNPDGGQWTTGDDAGGSPSSSSGAASEEPEHPTRYAARDTGTLTDETKGAPANSSAHDDSAEVHVAQVNDWRNLPVNLVEEEAPNGVGHAITRHVAKAETELKAEFPEDSYYGWTQDVIPKREGSFDSIENANDLVNRTLRENGDKVDLVVSGKLDFAFVETRFGFVTGYEVYRPDPYDNEFVTRKTYGVGVFIWRDPHSSRGFRVRTAYPMNFD